MDNKFNNSYGIKAENYFASIMNSLGLNYNYIDGWYDFNVEKVRVEVKSCELSIRQTKKRKGKKVKTYRSGKFHFTEEKNRNLQYKNNIWVCFILRNENDFMILGFIKAIKLKKAKHICIHNLKKIGLVSLNQWVGIINNKDKKTKPKGL